MKPFEIEAPGAYPEHESRVRSYTLIDTMTSTIVGEVMERTSLSGTAFPLEPRGYQNAVVMAHAWPMLQALRRCKYDKEVAPVLEAIEKLLRESRAPNDGNAGEAS